MRLQPVDKEIIDLIRNYCSPKEVTGLVKNLKQAEIFERTITGKDAAPPVKGQSVDSPLDRARLDRLITFCRNVLDNDEVPEVFLRIGDVLKLHGELNRAEEMYTHILERERESGRQVYIAEALMRRGEVLCRQGRWRESNADLGESKIIFQKLNEQYSVGRVENILGTNCAEQGQLEHATRFFECALAAFERSDQTLMAGSVLMNLGIVYNITGNWDLALTNFKRAQSHFEEVGDLNRLSEVHHNMGMNYLSRSSLNDAVREFNVSMVLSVKAGNVNLFGLANLGKAHVQYRLKDLPIALKLVNEAIDAFTRCNDRLSIADGYKVKGMIFREMRKLNFAESYLSTSLRINSELHNQLNMAETYFEIGILERKRGNMRKARQEFENAHTYFSRVGALGDIQRTTQEINNLKNGKK